jgi:hypothetical protein
MNSSMGEEMTEAERKAYGRGYNAGVGKRWPEHRPIAPPKALVRDAMLAATALRDAADGICATLSPDDDFVKQLGPRIDELDACMVAITKWLKGDE